MYTEETRGEEEEQSQGTRIRSAQSLPAEGGHARNILSYGDCIGEEVVDHGVHQHQVHHSLHICCHAKVLVIVACIGQATTLRKFAGIRQVALRD